MASNPVENKKTVIDPIFAIPEGATDLSYSKINDSTVARTQELDETTGTALYDEFNDLSYDGQFPNDPKAVLETPEILSVVSQNIRRSPGGNNVVDLVIEVDDIPGASSYEIRVAKI